MPRITPLFLFSLSVALTAYLFSPALRSFLATATAALSDITSRGRDSATMKRPRMPVYFFSHGGPDVMYNTSHPVYPVLQRIGAEITSLRPAAAVVFSAHWQSPSRASVLVNSAPSAPLIYDFSGFPPHYYAATYPNVGSPTLAARVCNLILLAGRDIACDTTHRGLDHGVWAGFHVAFHPDENPLRVPLVQVSLLGSEDPDAHYRLGRAVSALRDEGVVVIGAGMSVHNLHHMGSGPEPLPYAVSFDDALKEAVEAEAYERQRKMAQLCRRPDARQAHPWMDHLMPVHVAAGAAGDDLGKQLWTMKEGSFAWAQYRFGSVPKT
ncbi:Extradiol ring-cleavage dioxygenase, class III enzyme, subunit B [Colletotrichum caudatum]|nr:Extradiol ring-cleavage dioxygenase, class III enzyme, subunit B [Colletotrichum caudatum]